MGDFHHQLCFHCEPLQLWPGFSGDGSASLDIFPIFLLRHRAGPRHQMEMFTEPWNHWGHQRWPNPPSNAQAHSLEEFCNVFWQEASATTVTFDSIWQKQRKYKSSESSVKSQEKLHPSHCQCHVSSLNVGLLGSSGF